jgi:hypothetical protein
MVPMLTMTPEAGSFLNHALGNMPPDQEEGHCFRLAQSGDGRIALTLSEQTEDDLALVHKDRTVLVVNRQLAEVLKGRRVDVQDDGKGGEALVLS